MLTKKEKSLIKSLYKSKLCVKVMLDLINEQIKYCNNVGYAVSLELLREHRKLKNELWYIDERLKIYSKGA